MPWAHPEVSGQLHHAQEVFDGYAWDWPADGPFFPYFGSLIVPDVITTRYATLHIWMTLTTDPAEHPLAFTLYGGGAFATQGVMGEDYVYHFRTSDMGTNVHTMIPLRFLFPGGQVFLAPYGDLPEHDPSSMNFVIHEWYVTFNEPPNDAEDSVASGWYVGRLVAATPEDGGGVLG